MENPAFCGIAEDTDTVPAARHNTVPTARHNDVVHVEAKSDADGRPVQPEVREHWNKRMDFLLSIIGFAVDLANVWRFPYLCYKNGGGAFLVPYLLLLVFGALPLFFMELALGQFNRQGPITVWRICPIFKGVGFCAVAVSYFVSFYYNVIIGWSVYFIYWSFSSTLPWKDCNHEWNTDNCSVTANITSRQSPSQEFFSRAVLGTHRSDDYDLLGPPQPQLVLCVAIVYTVLYGCLFKGIKSSGKVVWITALMPYVIIIILLVRGVLLDGAADGVRFYLEPDLSRLGKTEVWYDAAVQILFSVGAGFGVHLTYASYNEFNNNCYRDCLIATVVNSMTSFLSGFVIFIYLGFMSHQRGIPIDQVATEGPGLVFQVYPEAIATLPYPQLWAVLFFSMLIMLGIDSGMGGLECVITGIVDEFGDSFKRWHLSRRLVTLLIVVSSFLVALTSLTPGGIYVFTWLDTYTAGLALLCSALFEALAVGWVYGSHVLAKDIHQMTGHTPALFWRCCWKFISPLFLGTVLVLGIVYSGPISYEGFTYPTWATAVGWTYASVPALFVPAMALKTIWKHRGHGVTQAIALSISPEVEHKAIKDGERPVRFNWRHWLSI
ncbi:sodium-dependent dopamine transporter-like isoform X2 [Amphibalanus amphitrite]|uniref:sodium-dependent dopamine transporter-like isoform X2 n=1 Tax=Amphibalanus amphitrite TaxID=1232801 RepID=UPI001C921535|nr:sodium-dependent dopamine transporter-like isoform X2 [Amphibalanus amphitrite]XP_043203218.1 sodium-dependent dopamine transporter-like isoform X2 [Amphibalanus amphitrite]